MSEKVVWLVVRGEQCFEALVQSRIACAFSVKPRCAFRSGLAWRQLKQGFFAVWIHEQFMVWAGLSSLSGRLRRERDAFGFEHRGGFF